MQAGERTSHLFRLANLHNALVLGTGDLSELALGFTTYGVGDHMSHYNVNASVPKTLIQHLIRWLIGARQFDAATIDVLTRIVETPISPELVPGAGDKPEQSSEAVVGPYELQDFHLYYISRFGYRPSKVAYLAHCAWGDAGTGAWPDTVPPDERRSYDLADDHRVARGVPQTLLPEQPVQALGHAERPEGRLGRLALARAATGARPAIRRRPCGSMNCMRTCRPRCGRSRADHDGARHHPARERTCTAAL